MSIKKALEIVHRIAATNQIHGEEEADALETVRQFIDQCDSWLSVLATNWSDWFKWTAWSEIDHHYDDGKHHGS